MPHKQRRTSIDIPVDIYRCDVYFVAGPYEDLVKKIKDLDLPQKITPTRSEVTRYQALTIDCDNGDVIIWFPCETYPGTIVHECTHAANMILEYNDVVDAGNHEALAYLTEFLFDNIMEGLVPPETKKAASKK